MPPALTRLAVAALATLALSFVAAAPAQASVSDPTQPDVVVATASPGKAAQFPDVVKLADGRLLAAYREGVAHTGMDGRILLVGSSDGGNTWSTPRVAVDTPYDDRDPKLVQTRSGAVLLSFFETDWSESPATLRGTFVVRSGDGGATWSAPTWIATHMTGPSTQTANGYWLGYAASHGEITQLPNGDLLAPLYGTLPDDPWQRATVVRSTDDGRTWDAATESTIAAEDGMHFQEPVLTVLKDGELVALIRTTVTYAYLSRSFDNGVHWTTPARTDMPASSHHLLALENGDVLVTYGDISGRFSPRRVTVGRLVQHPERSWDGLRDVWLYDSGTSDQANPSSAEVLPGRYLTLSYDTAHHTIVGFFSRQSDYLPDDPELPGRLDLQAMYEDGQVTVDTDMTWTSPSYPTISRLGAIDGDDGYWHSSTPGRAAPPDSSYTLTFAEPQHLRQVGVALKPGYAETAEVYVSQDGNSWRLAARYEEARTDETAWTLLRSEPTAKAVKVVVTDSLGEWAQLTELALRTTGAG